MCDTFWWMCRPSHHVSHFRIWGVCHSSYILHSLGPIHLEFSRSRPCSCTVPDQGNKYRDSRKTPWEVMYKMSGRGSYGRWYRRAKIIGEKWKGWLESTGSCKKVEWDGGFNLGISELHCKESVKDWERRGRFVSLGLVEGLDGCRMNCLTDGRRWDKVGNDILTRYEKLEVEDRR